MGVKDARLLEFQTEAKGPLDILVQDFAVYEKCGLGPRTKGNDLTCSWTPTASICRRGPQHCCWKGGASRTSHGSLNKPCPCGAAGTGRLHFELFDAQPKRLCELSHPQGWEQDGHAGLQG